MPKYVPVLLVAMIAGFVSYIALAPKGAAAPNLSLQTLDGQTVELAQLRGQPVMITFWATTCSSCIEEIPHLIELQDAFADKGLKLYGVAMDYDDLDDIRALVAARKLNYSIVYDASGEIASAVGPVRATPTTLLINPDGRIVLRTLGYLDMDSIKAQIAGYLS
jgi:peroxiredoxin